MLKYYVVKGGNPLSPHRLLFPISSKGSFICTFAQTGQHILTAFDRPVVNHWWERKITQTANAPATRAQSESEIPTFTGEWVVSALLLELRPVPWLDNKPLSKPRKDCTGILVDAYETGDSTMSQTNPISVFSVWVHNTCGRIRRVRMPLDVARVENSNNQPTS